MLYANREVSKALADGFVLHWKSVRPVPKITIDFGDGRVVERTITGNSIHYVLDCDGNVIDAVPGLYGPEAFLRQTAEAAAVAKKLASVEGENRDAALRQWHTARAAADLREWRDDLRDRRTGCRSGGGPAGPGGAVESAGGHRA